MVDVAVETSTPATQTPLKSAVYTLLQNRCPKDILTKSATTLPIRSWTPTSRRTDILELRVKCCAKKTRSCSAEKSRRLVGWTTTNRARCHPRNWVHGPRRCF